jgi:hypothetical protein
MEARLRRQYFLFFAAVFVMALLVLSHVTRSDGDDTYFYIYANEMGFIDYLRWRYATWTGRMGAEAIVYIIFRSNIWVWRVVNAAMLSLLPMGLIRLTQTVTGCAADEPHKLYVPLTAVAAYFMMSVMTLGYAAVWMNGSIFYTWTFTCGIWSLVPVAESVMGHGVKRRTFLLSIPLALIASMSIEQMGAVLIAFEVLAVLHNMYKMRRGEGAYLSQAMCNAQWLLIIQTVITVIGFAVCYMAPGNDLRTASEIETWMPEFQTLGVGRHILITAQWLLSSFANESKLFLAAIWCIGIALLWQGCAINTPKGGNRAHSYVYGSGNGRVSRIVWSGIAAIFTITALLPFAGIDILSDLGVAELETASCIEHVPDFADFTARMWGCMAWWSLALIFTFVWLCKVMGFRPIILLAYLAGIASEAILYFSPTMYASGERIYYLTDILLLFVLLSMLLKLRGDKARWAVCAGITAAGVCNFLSQLEIIASRIS